MSLVVDGPVTMLASHLNLMIQSGARLYVPASPGNAVYVSVPTGEGMVKAGPLALEVDGETLAVVLAPSAQKTEHWIGPVDGYSSIPGCDLGERPER